MRILYWTPRFWPDIGGIQSLAMRTLPLLSGRGHQFLVVTSHGQPGQPDQAEYQGIPIQRFPFWSALTTNDVPLIMKIRKQISELKRKFAPDLIHINLSGYTAFFQVATSRDYPTPTVVAIWNDMTGMSSGPDTTLRRLFNVADWVAAISKTTLDSACHVFPEIVRRSSVIYGCADERTPAPTPLDFDGPRILGIGRLSREKGLDVLIEAISLIADRYPKLHLRIIGDGPERSALRKQAAKLGLKTRVEWIGSVRGEQVPDHINEACLVVVPSRCQESFGLVAVEAAWMARPVVAANAGALAEIVSHDETGLLVEMENPRAMAQAMVELLSHQKRAEEMGKAGRLRVITKFSQAAYVAAYDSLYQQLTVEHGRAAGARGEAHAA